MGCFIDFCKMRRMIFELAVNDFKTKYAGSYFGIIWAFIQPIMTILVFWFVFEVGFRAAKISSVPFILWFSCGLVPWFFFSEAWGNVTNTYIEYVYLVKKVVFRISILPVIKILSALFVHIVFVVFLLLMFFLYGYGFDLYNLQLIYYIFCMTALIFGLGFITASITPFFRDLTQFIAIALQFGMWITPIMWDYAVIPEKYHWVFYLNPVFYIVDGFRDSLIDKVWFWQKPIATIIFWFLASMVLFFGKTIFRKAKPYFADVL